MKDNLTYWDFYKEEIFKKYAVEISITKTGQLRKCSETRCDNCVFSPNCHTQAKLDWFKKEYKPFVIDWAKLSVDVPIFVSNDGIHWLKRHFAKYENDIIYVWNEGFTSWTIEGEGCVGYKYARLTVV